MRLSTKGRYAVMAMVDLARHQGVRPVALADIAARQEISCAYLEQLFARLRRARLVIGARGPGGGYKLARAATDMPVSAIVTAVDEPLEAIRCDARSERGCMAKGERCLTHDLWDALGRQIETFLGSVSLDDVASGRLAASSPAVVRSVA